MPRARTLAIGGAVVGGLTFALYQMEDFKTPGVRNIERRHTAAGGGPTHTPASGTRMGDENDVRGRTVTQKGTSHVQQL